MRRVRYSVAMTLDGYIAGPNGEFDWIVADPDIDFAAMFKAFDTILMGRKTYDVTRTHKGPGMPGMSVYVLSRTLSPEDCPGVVVARDPAPVVSKLKDRPGKDIWLFGGGDLFRSLLSANLVDSVEVAIVPVLLGGGLPLLPQTSARHVLRLASHQLYPKTGTLRLSYDVVPNAA
jgi:dihydrofolate reductase